MTAINLRNSLDTLADSLLRECAATASVEIRVDVFKAVSAYYLGCNRVGQSKIKQATSESENTFESLVERLGRATDEGHA